ncbi:thioredoxin family protein, partial [Pseudomonas syringae]
IKTTRQKLAQLLGLALLFYALACWYGALSGQTDPMRPLGREYAPANNGAAAPVASQWQTITTAAELDRVMQEAQREGKPLVLDWYADWCISCKVIEHEVLPDPGVVARLSGYKQVRFDMTDSNAEQRALLDRYKLFGPPALLFFDKNGEERQNVRVIGEIDAAGLIERLNSANDQN